MSFELIVLGASGTYPTPGAACSGYLLRAGGVDVWVDAGPGTFPNLQRHTDYKELRALFLSHLHPDHIADFFPFYYARRYGLDAEYCEMLDVYGPALTQTHMEKMISIEGPSNFGDEFDFHPVSAGSQLTLDPFEFRLEEAIHPVETLAMRVSAAGRTLVYTADTGPGEKIVDLARGADTLLCEATLQDPIEELANIHLTAEQAGEIAEEAGVGRLVLTHIWPGLDQQKSVAIAEKRYRGEIILAADNLRLEV